jgi:hypothetical protein
MVSNGSKVNMTSKQKLVTLNTEGNNSNTINTSRENVKRNHNAKYTGNVNYPNNPNNSNINLNNNSRTPIKSKQENIQTVPNNGIEDED